MLYKRKLSKWFHKDIVVSLVFVVFSLMVFIPLYRPGFPNTHDGENHIARFANYYLAIRQGQLPPRWAPNLDAGLGSAVLNYNYPLANILSLPLTVAGFTFQNIMKALFIMALSGSMVGMYLLLRSWVGMKAAMLGSLTYGLAPYQFLNFYVRGNVGESLSFAVLPWVLLFLHKVKDHDTGFNRAGLVVSGASFLLSHNIIVLFAAPFIIAYVIVVLGSSAIRKFIIPLIATSLLVMFFWLPAYFEKDFTSINETPLSHNYIHHFVYFDQFFTSPWSHGISSAGPVDDISFRVGIFTLIGFLGVVLGWKYMIHKNLAGLLAIEFVLMLYLMQPLSNWIWKPFPILWFIQFPWRLLFFTTLTGSMMIGLAAEIIRSNKVWLASLIMLLMTTLTSVMVLPNRYFFNKDEEDWLQFPLSTTVLNEYDPPWFNKDKAINYWADKTGKNIMLQGDGEVEVSQFTGTSRKYTVRTKSPARVIEKGLYFPGWKTWVNGAEVDLNAYKHEKSGLINYPLDVGEYQIITRFTQDTLWRKAGNILTLAGILGSLGYIFEGFLKKKIE